MLSVLYRIYKSFALVSPLLPTIGRTETPQATQQLQADTAPTAAELQHPVPPK